MSKYIPLLLYIGLAWGQNVKVVVFDFSGKGIKNPNSLNALRVDIENELLKTKQYIVKQKHKVEPILEKEGFQLIGCDTECFVNIGSIIGVDLIISGNLQQIGNNFKLIIDIIDVGSGKLANTIAVNSKSGLINLIEKTFPKVFNALVEATPVQPLIPVVVDTFDNGNPLHIDYYLTIEASKLGENNSVKSETFHDNGQKNKEGTYKDGKKNGLYTWWYENGQKGSEGTYKNGKPDGLSTLWYENGNKEEENTYKDGKENGLYSRWYDNGQKQYEITYKDGKKVGLWTNWYDNGQKEKEGTYRNGEPFLSNYWNANGEIMVKDGDGFYTWYAYGQKKGEGNIKDAGKDGLWTYWYESGKKKEEGNYKGSIYVYDDIKDGLWIEWYESGKKEYEIIFKDGELISQKCWDEDGNECVCSDLGRGCK